MLARSSAPQRVRTPHAWICVSAYARLHVRIYLWKKCWHMINFLNLLDILHHLILILAFYNNLDFFFFFFFFAIFNPKFDGVKILGYCSYAIPTVPQVIPIHYKKTWVILNNFEALNASQQQTLVFSRTTRLREITQDLNDFLSKHMKYWCSWNFLVPMLNSSTVRSISIWHFARTHFTLHSTLNIQHSTTDAEGRQPSLDHQLDRSIC